MSVFSWRASGDYQARCIRRTDMVWTVGGTYAIALLVRR